MYLILVLFVLLAFTKAATVREVVSSFQAGSLGSAAASDLLLEKLQNETTIDYLAIEDFASHMNILRPAITAAESAFVNALTRHFITAGFTKLQESKIEFLYTAILLSTPAPNFEDFKDRLEALEVAVKSFQTVSTKKLYLSIVPDYIIKANLCAPVPFLVFKEGFLPEKERSQIIALFLQRFLPFDGKIGKNYKLLSLSHVLMPILLHNVKLPNMLFLRSLEVLVFDTRILRTFRLEKIVKPLGRYLKSAPVDDQLQHVLRAATRLMVADHALVTVEPKFYFDFAELYHFLSSKTDNFDEQKNIISEFREKFQEIEKLRIAITKIKKLGEILPGRREINEANIRFGLSSMDFFEKLNQDYGKQYPELKAMIMPVIRVIIDNFRAITNNRHDPLLEQHACLILRANFLFPVNQSTAVEAYTNILVALGMLYHVQEPKSDFAKKYKNSMTNEYIERCADVALFKNADAVDSLARDPLRILSVITFLRTHRDPKWKKTTINKYLVNLVKFTKLEPHPLSNMSVYTIALMRPEINPHELYLLFIKYFNEHLDNNGTVIKDNLVAFGEHLQTCAYFSSTEKAFISTLLAQIQK